MGDTTQKTKRQHFVPQSYLSRFCDENRQIWTFDKFGRKSFQSSILNVGQEKYFYDLPIDDTIDGNSFDPQIVEKALAPIESAYKVLIDECLAGLSVVGAQYTTLFNLAPYVAIQWMRTKEYRETAVAAATGMMRSLLDETIELNWPHKADEYKSSFRLSLNSEAALHGEHFFSDESINHVAGHLTRFIWLLGLSDSDQVFLSSDHPVVRAANLRDDHGPLVGLRDPGVEFILPLAPNAVLLILEPRYFGHLAEHDCHAVSLTAEQVRHCNRLQVTKSYRQVYSPRNDFSFVETICREQPEVCNPNRKRVEITVTQTGPMKSRTDVRIIESE